MKTSIDGQPISEFVESSPKILKTFVFVLFFILIPFSASGRDIDCEKLVSSTSKALLDIINSQSNVSDQVGSFENILKPLIYDGTLEFITGEIWAGLSHETRDIYIMSIREYLSLKAFFNLKHGFVDCFTVENSLVKPNGIVIVEGSLKRSVSYKKPKTMVWSMKLAGGKYLVADMKIDGMSIMAGCRSEIQHILAENNMDLGRLIQKLDDQSKEMLGSFERKK